MSQQIVASVRSVYPTPLGDQHAAFLIAVAAALRLGLLKKDTGSNIQLPDGTRVSQDIVMAPDGRIWDILQDAEGAANPTFDAKDPVDPSRYYAVGAAPSPVPVPPPVSPDLLKAFTDDVRASLGRLEAAVKVLTERQPVAAPVPPAVTFPPYKGTAAARVPILGSVSFAVEMEPK